MTQILDQIKRNCQCFISEFSTSPLYRAFHRTTPDQLKVKVRHRKPSEAEWEVYFNTHFSTQFTDIRQRSVFAYPAAIPPTANYESFFIFPIDGYSFTYSPTVYDSNLQYSELFSFIKSNFEYEDAAKVFIDNIEHSYKNDAPEMAVTSNSEVLIYGISHYFAVRSSKYDYHELINRLSV